MPDLWLGVDPGSKGAAATLDESGRVSDTFLFDGQNFASISQWFHRLELVRFGVIEQVSAMPGQGVSSMFTFGERYGFVQGVLSAYGMSHTLVRPAAWRKVVGLSLPTKREGQDANARTREVKGATVAEALRRWPEAEPMLRRVKDWPIGDALFLADCARRMSMAPAEVSSRAS